MSRARRADDWRKDLASARPGEAGFAQMLAQHPRIQSLQLHTGDLERLDFSFLFRGLEVKVDLKEKRQPYSAKYQELWPQVEPHDLFIVDETVYRRVVWQGGGGYLAVHDLPARRWVIFGPWELTLGSRVRYRRWGQRAGPRFAKGKLLLNLAAGASQAPVFRVDDLITVIEATEAARRAVDAVATRGQDLPEIG